MPLLSVIVCTHNPRADHLDSALAALRRQSLPAEQWELVIIDNASTEPLSNCLDLSWQPRARIVREDMLGIGHARVRGMREAAADLLLFVDDDNVLAPDYLERAVEISREFPFVGVWGGNVTPDFEVEPHPSLRPYVKLLALREVTRDVWANTDSAGVMEACAAGMCFRRSVAEHYCRELAADPRRKEIGSKGRSMMRGEDSDFAHSALEAGFGWGQFGRLSLTHLIPAERVSEDYLLRLHEGISASVILLNYLWGRQHNVPVQDWREKLKHFLRFFLQQKLERKFYLAGRRGVRAAQRTILQLEGRGTLTSK